MSKTQELKERIYARHKKWKQNNKDKIKKQSERYYNKNKETILKKHKLYRQNVSSFRPYKITKLEYQDMLEAQDHKCAICRNPENTIQHGNVRRISIDHCHKTGKVRGLLCNSCNHGLGCMKDDIKLLQEAIKYLKKWKKLTN